MYINEIINLITDGFQFKVMSYNVLAQYLLECHPYLYTDCYPKNLKWKVRASKIYDEVLSMSPDVRIFNCCIAWIYNISLT